MDNLIHTMTTNVSFFDVLTPVSVFVAVMFGIAQLRQNRRLAKRAHTLDILLSTSTTKTIVDNFNVLAKWDNIEMRLPTQEEDYNAIKEAFNFYEFISTAARKGVLDVDLIVESRGRAMMVTFDFYKPYILDRRTQLGSRDIWEHFEWFVEKQMRHRC